VVSALACAAFALVCLPGPVAAGRLRAAVAAPTPRRWHRRHLPTAAWLAAAGAAGLAVAAAGGALAAALVALTVRRRRARRATAASAAATAGEVAEALRRITDELRTGAHPAAALGGVGADGPRAAAVLADAAAAARIGDDVPRALHRSAARHPEIAGDLARIAGSWSLAERHGIPLADLLARAQHDIAWRVSYGRRVHAQLAGPRATTVVLTALPGLGLLLGQLLGADPLGVLRDGLPGQALLVAGTGLAAAGFAWCDRILRAAVPS
jgi:tight adherence protein B